MTTRQDVIDFVINEARLLDQRAYEDWIDLFTDDGFYWMPLEFEQAEPKLVNSLLYEDKLLMRVRVTRLAGDRTYSQKPKSRGQRTLQVPIIDKFDEEHGLYETYTPFHYVEVRGFEKEYYAGWARHSLVEQHGALKIKLKRVDLINSDSPHRNIQLFI